MPVVDIRGKIEEAVKNGLEKAGVEDTPENRRKLLPGIIEQFDQDLEESGSLTEKMWIRQFRFHAEDMLHDLSN